MGILSFFDRFRASSGDRSPWGDFFFEPLSARGSSGMRVSPDSALRLAAVYACVRVLSETMASLPLVVYRARADGGKDRVTDHWLYRLLAKRPNKFQNPFEWREMLQGHLALRGNAYNQIITNPRGEVTELMPLHPDRVRLELLPSGEFRYRFTDRFGCENILSRGQVWHLRGLSSDGLMGLSPIDLARESLGMALAAQDYGARFFANDAKPSRRRIWIEARERVFGSFVELNTWLAQRCRAVWAETRHTEHPEFTLTEMLETEREHLMPMPEAFDGYVEKASRVSSTCLVTVARNRYSVPCEWAGKRVSTRLYPTQLVVVAGDAVVAFQLGVSSVAIGLLAQKFSLFPDQRSPFLYQAELAIASAMGRQIKMLTPLIDFGKEDVVRLADSKGITGTYSCHTGDSEACGQCIACLEFQFDKES